MSERLATPPPRPPWLRPVLRRDALAGLLFMVVAALGLWISRNYPIGTATRMGTGYVPRLLCWILLGLGGVIFARAFFDRGPHGEEAQGHMNWRPVVFVTAALVVFGLALEKLGLVVSILLLIAVGAPAARELRWVETVVAAVVLVLLSWTIFILGLGITIPAWPDL